MFADVILHRRVPSKFESFTYRIPEGLELAPGQLVTVPFRKQKLPAIVRRLHKESPNYPTKIIYSARALSLEPWQMEFATWLSTQYAAPFSKAVDLFIPEKIWAPSLRKQKGKNGDASIKVSPQLSTTNNGTLKKLTTSLLATPTPKLLFEKTPIPRPQFYAELQEKTGSALFLFPELFALQKFAANIPQYHGELTETEKAKLWEAVRSGEITTIAGTRAALFLPFKKLSAIVVDFEHSDSYNEKREPRYNAIGAAEKLAQHFKIPLILISASPRLATWHKAATYSYEKHEWQEAAGPAPITVIDMKDERRKENYSIFADMVREKMAAALAKNKQILLFINRRGEASALLCSDCGLVFRCDDCASALVVHQEHKLQCHRCKMQKPFPVKCPTCGNLKLKSLGYGTEHVEKEVKKLYAKANVIRLDTETKKTIDEKALQKADVIIATQIIDKPFALPRLTFSCALAPDHLLNFPNYLATERVWQLLTRIRQLTNTSNYKVAPRHMSGRIDGLASLRLGLGEMVIQTFLPDHPLYTYLAQNRPEKFYEHESLVRKSLALPPFGISA